MADYGLLGGLAEGLKQGLGAYQQGRQFQDEQRRKIEEKALQEKLAKIGMFDKGIMETDDGGLSYTPEKQQERMLAEEKAKADIFATRKNAEKKGERDPFTMQMLQARLDDISNRKEDRAVKREEMMRDKSGKLSDKVAPLQSILGAVGEVENQLGFQLDDFNSERGTFTKDGKEQKLDLPGVNLLGQRLTFYTPKGRKLDDTLATVFNVELKDRSGAAVTNNELMRLKQEFGEGKLRTDAEKVDALKRYRDAAMREMQNREAGFSPDVRDLYQGEGGQLSSAFDSARERQKMGLILKDNAPRGLINPNQSQATGKIKVSDGKGATLLIDPADLKDAEKDGFKKVP
jgi:hypothetical protein